MDALGQLLLMLSLMALECLFLKIVLVMLKKDHTKIILGIYQDVMPKLSIAELVLNI